MPLRETLERIRSAPPPENEETTKFQILAPILMDLGWNTFDPNQVLYEYPVGDKGKGKVDIALKGPNNLVALIEAKAPAQDLKPHVGQVLGYAFHEGVDICVLTNGLEWWLYLPLEKGPPKERRFTSLRIKKDPIEQLADDLETFLGKDNLVNENAHKRAKQVLKAKHQAAKVEAKLPKVWQSMLTEPDSDLVDLVRQRAYKEIGLRPDSKQVTAMLSGSPIPTVVSRKLVPTKPALIPPKPPSQRAKSKKPTGFWIWGEYYTIKLWKDLLLGVANVVHNQHGAEFIKKLLAYETKKGNPYASRTFTELREPRKMKDEDVYLETNLNAKQIKFRVCEFLNLFDYPSSDLKILFD